MKDNRFIDLLNLYIDRQITTAETAELEAEIQNNPKRQAVYRQYCQIHSATKLVYESFRAGAAEQPATAVPTGRPATIELFENRRRTNWAYYAGGLAAAACLALVFVRSHPSAPLAAPTTVAAVKAQPAVVAVAAPVVVAQAPAAPVAEAKPGLISLRNANANPDYSSMLAALREQDEAIAANERHQSGRVQSLFADNMFESKQSPVTAPEQRTLRQQTAEFTAFQFQR
jgi:hypothetical protein